MNKICILTSLYKSQDYIEEFYFRHKKCIDLLELDYEFIFVNDGSPDKSADVVKSLIQKDNKIKLINLSRNFGQHAAMTAGLSNADGRYIYVADCDLEESPENITEMYEILTGNEEIDVVFGVYEKRSGGFFRNYLGAVFYYILGKISEVTIVPNQAWQRIMKKTYVEALLRFQEAETIPAGIMTLTGFNQHAFPITKNYKGSSSYSVSRRFRLAIDSITSFSSKPLVFICLMGLLITFISFISISAIIITRITGYTFQSGWLSIVASIWLVGGLILSSIGILGIYLAKVFNQVKGRPLFIVKEIITNTKN